MLESTTDNNKKYNNNVEKKATEKKREVDLLKLNDECHRVQVNTGKRLNKLLSIRQ